MDAKLDEVTVRRCVAIAQQIREEHYLRAAALRDGEWNDDVARIYSHHTEKGLAVDEVVQALFLLLGESERPAPKPVRRASRERPSYWNREPR